MRFRHLQLVVSAEAKWVNTRIAEVGEQATAEARIQVITQPRQPKVNHPSSDRPQNNLSSQSSSSGPVVQENLCADARKGRNCQTGSVPISSRVSSMDRNGFVFRIRCPGETLLKRRK